MVPAERKSAEPSMTGSWVSGKQTEGCPRITLGITVNELLLACWKLGFNTYGLSL